MNSLVLDPRVLRTRAALRDGLMILVVDNSFAKLTIQDVTRQAGLNRTTFYLHYTGLHELLEDCARQLFSQMRAEIYANQFGSFHVDPTRLEPFVRSVFNHLEQHGKFYRAMLGKQGDPYFRSLFQDLLMELIFEPLNASSLYPNGMVMRFFSAGFTGIASWWLDNNMPISIDQAARQITRDILPGYLRLMERGMGTSA
jgi:AcrR family transcriptional regulator